MAEISRDLIRKIEKDVDAVLVEIARKHGLSSLKCSGAMFNVENFTLKVQGVVDGGLDESAKRYEDNCQRMHLPVLGTWFNWGGSKKYQIVGMTSGWSVLARGENDKVYRFKPSMINPVNVEVKTFDVLADYEKRRKEDDAEAKAERKWEARVS